MQTAAVKISKDGIQHHQARILFDTGSQRTFISEDMKNKLKLEPIRKEILDVTTFGTVESNRKTYNVVTFKLLTKKEDIEVTALVTPVICPPLSSQLKNFRLPPELKGLRLADPLAQTIGNLEINIIIGNDNFGQLITGKIIKSKDEALIATGSKFGWLLSGPITANHSKCANSTLCQRVDTVSVDEKLDNKLTRFWEINQIPDDNDDKETIITKFEETIRFNKASGRYNVSLPWKENTGDLPTNFGLSKKRLNSLQHSLNKKDPALLLKYNNQISEQLDSGFIEKVYDLNKHEGILHYIPHFPVFKADSTTTKMRIVYDASARTTQKSLSLNDCLHTGPNLMQDLIQVLIRFRSHKIALTADIEKAFLQIELNRDDRDATRFLWLKNTNHPVNDTNNLEVYRFCRVLFGAAPSPFLLNATIQYHLKPKDTWVSKDLVATMYMDNVVTGTDCEEKALEYFTLSRNYLQQAGMNLRQWVSNSTLLNTKARENNAQANQTVKVLGLKWDSKLDTLSLSLEKMIEETQLITSITKRSVLSIASKLFDPLGYVEPITVKAKIMIQELWKENIRWDQSLPNEHKENWLKWFKDVNNLTSFHIPRRYFQNEVTEKQLHIFCDSSQKAYGAIAYLRGTSEREIHTALLIAKTRVAPVKPQTLPRLELLAALLGAKLSQYLSKILKLENECEVILWSDSQIVLSWISSNKQLQQFIRTRINKIKEMTSPNAWRFCPTATNPADLLTRGINTSTLNDKKRLWFEGPPWLKGSQEMWPIDKGTTTNLDAEVPQMEITIAPIEETPNIHNIIDITKYSTLNRVIRAIAVLIHYAGKWKKRVVDNNITSKAMITAKTILIKAMQQQRYKDERLYLRNKSKFKQPAIVQQLGLYLDETDILRCRGRLHNTELPYDTKFPILLPKESHLTKLIVQDMHVLVLHGGVRETLTQIRQTYWIPQGRQLVKKLISKCVICRKTEGPPLRSLPTPPLPEPRVKKSRAFQYTGIDYAGPLYIRNYDSHSTSKVYICLFTCATIRAVHLELAEDLTTQSFLRAFRRFVSRRGIPEYVISDNAQTFKAGAQELKDMIYGKNETQNYCTSHDIKWYFIAERAPWWGGFYERMVALTKRYLKKVIGRASLNMAELNTIVTEVEAVLNSRPLTYPYLDIDEEPPITPAHFICGQRLLSLPDQRHDKSTNDDPDYIPPELTSRELCARAKFHETLIQSFWKQWQREYLTDLREYHRQKKSVTGHTIAKGDIMLIHDQTPRNRWKTGIVTELYPGKDGLVRSVSLRVSTGRILTRAIEKLYPLELSHEELDIKNTKSDENEEVDKRPIRQAAQRAAQRIKEQS